MFPPVSVNNVSLSKRVSYRTRDFFIRNGAVEYNFKDREKMVDA